jgi:hypothetical protein
MITTFTVMPSVFAGEEEDEEEEEDETGFGTTEREQEREMESEEGEDEDEGGIALGSGTGNVILYGTIAAIIAAIGYSGFKIVSSRKKTSPKSQ